MKAEIRNWQPCLLASDFQLLGPLNATQITGLPPRFFALMGFLGAQKPVRFAPLEELTPFFSADP